MNRFELITTLAAVEAVEGRGATPGERDAARRARLRLEHRLATTSPPPPTSHAEELAASGHLHPTDERDRTDRPEPSLPSRAELGRRLRAVRDGRTTAASLARWAARMVDWLVLPDHPPDDPRSVVPEIILFLAGADPAPGHLAAALRFLDSPPADTTAAWSRWLDALAGG